MEDKNKIANFISYHNIIRPIEYALLAWPFMSSLFFLLYIIGYFFSPSTHYMEKMISIIGIIFSIIGFIFGIKLKRKYMTLYKTEPGKSLYEAELWKYICFGFQSFILTLDILAFEKINIGTFITLTFLLFVFISSVIFTTGVVKIMIKNDKYNGRKHISERMIIFSTSGTCFAILIFIKNVMLRTAEANGPSIFLFIGFIAVEVSIVPGTVYYLKLKYAKKYGLEEYFPTRPNPSPYTNWK